MFEYDGDENIIGTIDVEEFKEKIKEIDIGDINIETCNNKQKYIFKDAWNNDIILLEKSLFAQCA